MSHRLTRRDLLVAAGAGLLAPLAAKANLHASPLAQSPTHRYSADGYDFDETSDEWSAMCEALPCFAALHWPDYSTKVVEDRINGQAVVIQLWKGFCPQFLNAAAMPGGTGAEVGIYKRIPGKQWQRPPMFPAKVYDAYRLLAGNSELWWPAPELKTEIDWELSNPNNKEMFCRVPKKVTYWRNTWMENGSYTKFKASHSTPGWAWNYSLRYTINGKTYPVW